MTSIEPLDAAIETGLTHLFPATSWALWQPRTALAWQFAPGFVLRTGFGVFSDILPGSVADLVGANPPYVNTFQGGLLGSAGGLAIAPGVPGSAIDATVAANQAFLRGFQQGELSCAARAREPPQCLPPVALNAVPDGRLRAPYFLQWSFGIEHQVGNSGSLRAQYVGTRAIDLPYQTEVNGYQTVCAGCFAPFPYGQPADPRFAAVDQLSTGANSHYNGLQLTAEKRLARGLRAACELHLESLPGYGFKRRLSFIFVGGHSVASAGRTMAAVRQLRLRRAPQLQRILCLCAALPHESCAAEGAGGRMADFRHGVLAQRSAIHGPECAL